MVCGAAVGKRFRNLHTMALRGKNRGSGELKNGGSEPKVLKGKVDNIFGRTVTEPLKESCAVVEPHSVETHHGLYVVCPVG